jgi:ribosomal protein S18 acetylase RimI-like enzyme
MTPQEILALSDLNLAEAAREMARWHLDSEIQERGELLCVAGPDPFPAGYANAALALGSRPPRDPHGLVAAARDFFASRGRGFTFWLRTHLDAELARACAGAGLRAFSDSPGMLLEAALPDAPAPPGARVALVEDVAGMRDLASVSARAYASIGLPPAVCARQFEQPERLLAPHLLAVVAYSGGAAQSAALAILSHGIAGLYWVGTAPEGRKRGLGEACTRLAGNAAFARGARALVLQASRDGEPIYRRMGYREITRYTWWLQPPPRAGA